jgi:hypothetical protein
MTQNAKGTSYVGDKVRYVTSARRLRGPQSTGSATHLLRAAFLATNNLLYYRFEQAFPQVHIPFLRQ